MYIYDVVVSQSIFVIIYFYSRLDLLKISKIMFHEWNKFYIQLQKHENCCLLHSAWFFNILIYFYDDIRRLPKMQYKNMSICNMIMFTWDIFVSTCNILTCISHVDITMLYVNITTCISNVKTTKHSNFFFQSFQFLKMLSNIFRWVEMVYVHW